MGDDEFTVILPEIKNLRHVLSLCTRILKTELKNIVIDNQELRITASIGISFYPDDGEDIESLIKNFESDSLRSLASKIIMSKFFFLIILRNVAYSFFKPISFLN